MEVMKKKKIKSRLTGFDVFPNLTPVMPAQQPKPPASPPAPLIPSREPLEPAQQTVSGLPLVGYPNQQHLPLRSGTLNGVQLYRCRCGLLLAEYDGKLWWVPVAAGMARIETKEQLAEVLSHGCWSANLKRKIARTKAARQQYQEQEPN